MAEVTSRTAIETDWECGMKYWWMCEEGGTGIVPAVTPTYFAEGTDGHSMLESIAHLEDPRGVGDILPPPPTEPDQIAFEVWARLVGWSVAFALYVEPRLREEEDLVSTEKEITLDRDPLLLGVIPDRVGRGKESGLLRYREWKSTGVLDTKNFADYWPHAVQLHLGIQALMEEMGEKVEWAQVMGMTKGQEKDGKLLHPYVWAWWKNGEWLREYTYKAERVPVWEYPGGVPAWVEFLGPNVAATVFPLSRRVYLDPRLVDSLVVQRANRVVQVSAVRELAQKSWADRVVYFEQRFTKCRPMIGAPCAYREACWNASVNADPLGSGLYKRRVPHHELESLVRLERSHEAVE